MVVIGIIRNCHNTHILYRSAVCWMRSVIFPGMKQRCRSSPAQSCTPRIPKMKNTKKQMSRTFPSIGNVSSSNITSILKSTSEKVYTCTYKSRGVGWGVGWGVDVTE